MEEDKKEWNLATHKFKGFYDRWLESSAVSKFIDTFPYKLSLGMDRSLGVLLDHYTVGAQIIVTKSYENIYRRLLRLRENDVARPTGAVITGQPGTGESL